MVLMIVALNRMKSLEIKKSKHYIMKQLVKSTLAIVALAALSSQAVNAQSQTSQVNSRERILQVLDQSRPNEYVPAAFFLHFENKEQN